MKYDCLIIDDEKVLADNTCEYFNMFDVKTIAVYSKEEAEAFFKEHSASLILLDINLGDGSGFELCKTVRKTMDVPILFISARNTDDDKIIALNIGGDDYIEKPYSLGVVLAKVKVVLKRYQASENIPGDVSGIASKSVTGSMLGDASGIASKSATESTLGDASLDKSGCTCKKDTAYNDGHLRLDDINRAVFVDDEQKKLTSIEYRLLKYLTDNKDRLVTKSEIFDNVWNDKFTTDGTLNVHIRKIREEIETDPQNPKYIVTVWKEGYKFISRNE